ncbi:MAG TPA: hypothetical protein VFE98_07495 [Candidatus Bathyarchaeia archaeon]|nr:hypothetical protein [Candidatus Bathyarchaeia archaeon]
MALDASLTVAIASFLLSLSGVSVIGGGDFIYVSSARRAFQIQIGIFDWISIFLLDFFYIFAMWTYVTVRGSQLSLRRYLELGCLGLLIVFLGNAVKVFAEVYVAATSGALTSGSDVATMASLDVVGFMVMFGIVLLAVGSTCLVFAKGRAWRLGWPFPSNPSKTV